MIIGNQQAQESVEKYFDLIKQGMQVTFPFLLVTGPEHIGKTSIIEKYVASLLGTYRSTDYLPLYDMSSHMGKQHTLKVEVPTKDQRIAVGETYHLDMGTRDIVQWLALSPVGTYKVVLLENIERMTNAAANAFLKTFEEPLPNRLIIATTSNRDALLDTIVSRAFLIPFHIPSSTEVTKHLYDRYPEKTDAQRLFVSSFALGRVGLAKHMLENEEQVDEMSEAFVSLMDLLTTSARSVVKTHQLVQLLQERLGAEKLLDALLYACMHMGAYPLLDRLMHARHMIHTNVNTDNILFDVVLRA